ncbi:MAG: YihA family ribosome biogenesis GTP-binding protein [Deltaproteobacteria bacterium]|nr:YihA family ribosome biogenesis GTP-binding protein [Deltaproteobacteria bacterium]
MDITFLKSAFREDQYPESDRPEIAFAGRSNVGKSSLINVMTNRRKLARTSSTPGRTQAINFFSLGELLYLVDLPGYGYARVPERVKRSWGSMVETYLRRRPGLRAVVVILDIRRDPRPDDIRLLEWLKVCGRAVIPVLTKTDKVSRQQGLTRSSRIAGLLEGLLVESPTLFSARTGEGRKEIWERIEKITGIGPYPGRRP